MAVPFPREQQRLACPLFMNTLVTRGTREHIRKGCDIGFKDLAHLHEHLKNRHYNHPGTYGYVAELAQREIANQFHPSKRFVPKEQKWYQLYEICCPGQVKPKSAYSTDLLGFLSENPDCVDRLLLNAYDELINWNLVENPNN